MTTTVLFAYTGLFHKKEAPPHCHPQCVSNGKWSCESVIGGDDGNDHQWPDHKWPDVDGYDILVLREQQLQQLLGQPPMQSRVDAKLDMILSE